MNLDIRKQNILLYIIDRYIQTGEPVSSKALCERLGVSSATIRNEMMRLEELGFLRQPHTSAGRVPTENAYRFYVDRMIGDVSLPENEKAEIDHLLSMPGAAMDTLLTKALGLLSDLTGCATISTMPDERASAIRDVSVVKAGGRMVLLIVYTSCGVVQNGLLKLDHEPSDDLLAVINRVAAETFEGVAVADVTPALIQTAVVSSGELMLELSPVMFALYELITKLRESGVLIEGQSNLLLGGAFDGEAARQLLSFLNAREHIYSLLTGDEDFNIVIGRESNQDAMENASVLTTKYKLGDTSLGSIGIVGPTRMDYARMIARLSYLADKISGALSHLIDE